MKAKAFIGSFWFKLAAVIAGILTIAYIAILLIYNRKKKRRMKKVKKSRKF